MKQLLLMQITKHIFFKSQRNVSFGWDGLYWLFLFLFKYRCMHTYPHTHIHIDINHWLFTILFSVHFSELKFSGKIELCIILITLKKISSITSFWKTSSIFYNDVFFLITWLIMSLKQCCTFKNKQLLRIYLILWYVS